jgi:hypothetical protein
VKRFAGSDDARRKKEHVMTAKTNEQDEPADMDRFRYELAHDIERFIAKSLELWATCETRHAAAPSAAPARIVNASPNGVNHCRRFRPNKRERT